MVKIEYLEFGTDSRETVLEINAKITEFGAFQIYVCGADLCLMFESWCGEEIIKRPLTKGFYQIREI